MGRRTRECFLCGEKYNYCPTCSQDKTKPTWMAEFHDENCKDIFSICTRFNMQLFTKEEAREAIETCDLSNKENFKDSVKRDLANIFAEEPKQKRGKRAELGLFDEAVNIKEHEVVIETEE